MILSGAIDGKEYSFHSLKASNYLSAYYSENSNAKILLESWYKTNITDKGFDDKVETGYYYCEQAKVKFDKGYYAVGSAVMIPLIDYTPSFECAPDANGYGLIYGNIGLLTYDEVVYAGGYKKGSNNTSYYLYDGNAYWTMSSAGRLYSNAVMWVFASDLSDRYPTAGASLRPVINLKADVILKGTGESNNHYVVE